MGEETVTVRISRWDRQRMDRCIERGLFRNRSDLIRTALRNMADRVEDVPEIIRKIGEQAKRDGVTPEMVRRWSKEAGNEAHRKK